MKIKLSVLALMLFFICSKAFAYKTIEDIATKAGGYDIPITICIPDMATEKMPVMFFVHGGGWNGGDDKSVPGASVPSDCEFLCDQMGIIYVGLAYRCKGNKGTFNLALQDLEASISWFEERADEFNADMSRIGFSGGSAGTTLSAVLSHRYPSCKVYTGREGMYNVLDLDSTLSNFPNTESRAEYGLVSREQKLEASPFYHVRKKPAAALLLHGKDDWLCHYTQSVKYAEKLKEAGGDCKVVLYDDINHTCLSKAYPEVFENSIMEIAHLYAKGYDLKKIDFNAIEQNVNNKMAHMYPHENIPIDKLIGSWKSNKEGTITFNKGGEGELLNKQGTQSKKLTYTNNGSKLLVKVDGEENERSFFMRKNEQVIYELITENNRWKSRRNDYKMQ